MKKLYQLSLMLMLVLMATVSKSYAHSVQVAYCVSCTGALRLYVEHWHGTEDPNSTTMTITTTINGVTTSQTASPAGAIYNTTFANLPDCATPATTFASCAQANSYNNWVIYDFPNAAPGAVVNITVVSGNNVFTEACTGGMYPASTGNFTIPVPPAPIVIQGQSACGGQNTQPVNFPPSPGVIYSWTNSNPGIGLPASGVGDLPSFTPTSSTVTQVATITVDYSCSQATFTITVLPSPDPIFDIDVNSNPNFPSTRCFYDPILFTSSGSTIAPPNTITDYAWTFGDGGTANTPNPSHQYAAPGTYNVGLTITGSNGCVASNTTPVTVYPKPVANFTATSMCLYDPVPFSSATANVAAPSTITDYAWDFGDGNTSIAANPTNLYATDGTYNVTLVVFTENMCLDTITIPVVVHPVPVANFTVTNECLYDALPFSSALSSINAPGTIATYAWDFGDGNTSALPNPSHQYATDGTYNVNLTLTSNNGCVHDVTLTAIAHPVPVPAFTFTNQCAYDPIAFNAATSTINAPGTIATYDWDFGDGNTGIGPNPANLYATDGTYTVELTTTSNNNCVNTITQNVTAFPVPEADFTYQSQCLYDAVPFSSAVSSINAPGTITTYAWDFGDGNTSALPNPSNTYGVNGNFNVTLTLTSGDNCTNTVTYPISLYPVPNAAFTFVNSCQYDAVPFTSTSTVNAPDNISTFEWTLGDGQNSLLQNPSHQYAADGTYSVQLITTTNNNCKDTVEQTITVFPVPQPAFTFTPACLYDPTNFVSTATINAPGTITNSLWNFGDGSPLASGTTVNHSYPNAGNFNVQLITTSVNNCVNDVIQNIWVHHVPVANFTAAPICENTPPTVFVNTSSVAFGAIVNYDWDFADGQTSTSVTPTNTFAAAGTYNVELTVTTDSGCVNNVIVPVIVRPKPTAEFTSNITEGCSPVCIDFQSLSTSNATAIINSQWTYGNGTSSNQPNNNRCFINDDNVNDISFDVRLIVTNDFGCRDTAEVVDYVSVFHNPIAEFSASPQEMNMYQTDVQFINTSIGADAYAWDLGDGTLAVDFEPFHTYLDTGVYEVQLNVTTVNGCTDFTSLNVTVYPVISLYVPNAFTPDGDELNDEFIFQGYGLIGNNLEFMIFDRWGDLIYYTQQFKAWDGTHNSVPCLQDVYTYKVRVTDVFGEEHVKIGHVSLLR
jgi:gliding motility-associated-like protein